MTDFYPEMIQAEAVKAVEAYINNQIPLSESIAIIAEAKSLNPDQIKRLIEATNQICYLKLQTLLEERTFEFPLADYKEVMAKVLGAEPTMDKQANEYLVSPLSIVTGTSSGLNKEASAKEWTNVDMVKAAGDQDKAALLYRTIQRECHRLEKIASDCDIMVETLLSATRDAKRDSEFLEKLAFVAKENQLKALTKLAGMKGDEVDSNLLFREKDLKEVRSLCNLYKEANELLAARDELGSKLEKAASSLDNLFEKSAFVGTIAGYVAKQVGKATGKAAKVTGKGAFKGGKAVVSSPAAGAGAFGAVDYATNPKNVKVKNRV